MSKKLYVGGIPYRATNEELAEFFAPAGNVVSAVIIIDKIMKRSKGFGFVEYETEEEASKAISMFHGADMGGRNLTVTEARPQEDRGENGDRARRSY
jgi:RNA recognition motif-containing protein